MKIGRNEKCSCGSGKKYKNCCLNVYRDEENITDIDVKNIIKEIKKKSRIKECLHPDKEGCSEKIIGAHSIQNNKILNKISTDGMVYMFTPHNNDVFEVMPKWGRKQATVFTGFCGIHDCNTFKLIENEVFDSSEDHIFLYIYRAFCLEYHKKKEAINMDKIFKDIYKIELYDKVHNGLSAYEVVLKDLESYKAEFDKALMIDKYNILTSIVWNFDKEIKFAASGGYILEYDLVGNKIQNINCIDVRREYIYISIFPEQDKSYCIISWLKSNDELFKNYKNQLESLDINERKKYINNLIPIITENIAINPKAWDGINKYKKEAFIKRFTESIDLPSFNCKMLATTQYDLFSL